MHSKTFHIQRDCYNPGINIYEAEDFTFKPGVTVLVGCNGAGKTTLMQHMQRTLERESIKFLAFDNIKDGRNTARQKALMRGDIQFVAQSVMSSEGENIILNIGSMAEKIGGFVRSKKTEDELWIFFDAIDSGLSIDNVLEVKEDLFKPILKDCQNRNVYIIVSANAYEFANGEQCLDVSNGKYISFGNYSAYKQFIVMSRKKKDKRYR